MGKNSKRRVVLDDYKAKKAEEGSIEIETADGSVYTVPPPELWSDEVGEAARANDDVGAAKAMLGGDEEYARFVAAGGSATILWSIVKDEKGATIPESSASASS